MHQTKISTLSETLSETPRINRVVKESEVADSYFPKCVCPYKTGNTFMMIEVNTGSYPGSLKPITPSYTNLAEMLQQFEDSKTVYPVLRDTMIYNDKYLRINGRM